MLPFHHHPAGTQVLRDITGPAGISLASSFVALGALLAQLEVGFGASLLGTLTTFAMPGQLAGAEVYAQDGGLLAIAAVVALVNLRLMPMTASLLPRVGRRRHWLWLAHLIAVTSWLCFMRARLLLPASDRFAYMIGTGLGLLVLATASTGLGYWAGEWLPPFLVTCLLFLAPAHFLCMTLQSIEKHEGVFSLVVGGLIFLPAEHYLPGWGLVAAGLIGGLTGFVWESRR